MGGGPLSSRRTALRTYSHLMRHRRVPSEYDLATSDLLYYVGRGFEVDVPLAPFYERHQTASPLVCADWEAFRDPRETTYARYTALAAAKESHLQAVLDSLESSGDDARLPDDRRALLESLWAPLRFAGHGLQMLAAYVGQMAPSGRITVAALAQAADEMRRVHRIAYRIAQLRRHHPSFAAGSLASWQGDPAWQPLRRAIELRLVAFDFGEAFVALNVCLKPALDGLLAELGRFARAGGDFVLSQLLASFDEDARWHRAWTQALLELTIRDRPANRAVVQGWIARWGPDAAEATRALAVRCGDAGPALADAALTEQARWLASLGLEAP